MTTRRKLAAALPLLMIAGAMGGAAAKSAGPAPLACLPGKPCHAPKGGFSADDGSEDSPCPYCSGFAPWIDGKK